jgi:hypothetical protein
LLIEPYLEARTDGNGKARTYTVLEGLSCSPNGVEVWKTLSDGSISGLTLSGQTSFADGTSAAPAQTWTSESTLGWYRAGSSDVRFASNGSDWFRIANNQVLVNSLAAISWGSNGVTSFDVALWRDAAGVLALRNGTNAQGFRVYNTFTDASNYERGAVRWSGNEFQLFTDSLGTGSVRNIGLASAAFINFRPAGTLAWQMNSSGHFICPTDATYDIGATSFRPRNGFFAGTLSFGTFTGNADAPVTGFITITDSGGTTRKLAVIA